MKFLALLPFLLLLSAALGTAQVAPDNNPEDPDTGGKDNIMQKIWYISVFNSLKI